MVIQNLTILTHPNPLLYQHSKKVEQITATTHIIVFNMLKLLAESNGIGLAAPQVGILERIIIVKVHEPIVMINPDIVSMNSMVKSNEGCLSVPGQYIDCDRYKDITVTYADLLGKQQKIQATELLAFCIQHEIDHLDGKLILN